MIWDIIRDFIVRYITGGLTSEGQYFSGFIGDILDKDVTANTAQTDTLYFPIGSVVYSGDTDKIYDVAYISLGNWLATTLTAGIMILGIVMLCLLVRWVFKTVVNAFAFRR